MSPVFDHPQTSYKRSAVKVQAGAKRGNRSFSTLIFNSQLWLLLPLIKANCWAGGEKTAAWLVECLLQCSCIVTISGWETDEKNPSLDRHMSFIKVLESLPFLKLISADNGCPRTWCVNSFQPEEMLIVGGLSQFCVPTYPIVLHTNIFEKYICFVTV